MSQVGRLRELVDDQRRRGVEFRPLGEVADISTGQRPSDEALASGGPCAFMNGGTKPSGAVPVGNTPGDTVTIPSRGSVGVVGFSAEEFWCGPLCYRVRSSDPGLLTRFLYYALKTGQDSIIRLQQSGSIPALNKKELQTVRVPVPPTEIQSAVVDALDRFALLEAELESELESRRQQYAHYRDSAVSSEEIGGAPSVPLGELGSLYGGLTGKSKADFDDGNARFVSYVNVYNNLVTDTEPSDFVRIGVDERQTRVRRGDILFTASSEGPTDVGMSSGVTTEPPEPLYLNSFCFGFRPNDPDALDPEFAKHAFRSAGVRRQIVKTANGVTRFNVSKERFRQVLIPLPPLERQRQVAQVLDAFHALVADSSIGIPAELRARRQQYEHYRDRLLTFEPAAT